MKTPNRKEADSYSKPECDILYPSGDKVIEETSMTNFDETQDALQAALRSKQSHNKESVEEWRAKLRRERTTQYAAFTQRMVRKDGKWVAENKWGYRFKEDPYMEDGQQDLTTAIMALRDDQVDHAHRIMQLKVKDRTVADISMLGSFDRLMALPLDFDSEDKDFSLKVAFDLKNIFNPLNIDFVPVASTWYSDGQPGPGIHGYFGFEGAFQHPQAVSIQKLILLYILKEAGWLQDPHWEKRCRTRKAATGPYRDETPLNGKPIDLSKKCQFVFHPDDQGRIPRGFIDFNPFHKDLRNTGGLMRNIGGQCKGSKGGKKLAVNLLTGESFDLKSLRPIPALDLINHFDLHSIVAQFGPDTWFTDEAYSRAFQLGESRLKAPSGSVTAPKRRRKSKSSSTSDSCLKDYGEYIAGLQCPQCNDQSLSLYKYSKFSLCNNKDTCGYRGFDHGVKIPSISESVRRPRRRAPSYKIRKMRECLGLSSTLGRSYLKRRLPGLDIESLIASGEVGLYPEQKDYDVFVPLRNREGYVVSGKVRDCTGSKHPKSKAVAPYGGQTLFYGSMADVIEDEYYMIVCEGEIDYLTLKALDYNVIGAPSLDEIKKIIRMISDDFAANHHGKQLHILLVADQGKVREDGRLSEDVLYEDCAVILRREIGQFLYTVDLKCLDFDREGAIDLNDFFRDYGADAVRKLLSRPHLRKEFMKRIGDTSDITELRQIARLKRKPNKKNLIKALSNHEQIKKNLLGCGSYIGNSSVVVEGDSYGTDRWDGDQYIKHQHSACEDPVCYKCSDKRWIAKGKLWSRQWGCVDQSEDIRMISFQVSSPEMLIYCLWLLKRANAKYNHFFEGSKAGRDCAEILMTNYDVSERKLYVIYKAPFSRNFGFSFLRYNGNERSVYIKQLDTTDIEFEKLNRKELWNLDLKIKKDQGIALEKTAFLKIMAKCHFGPCRELAKDNPDLGWALAYRRPGLKRETHYTPSGIFQSPLHIKAFGEKVRDTIKDINEERHQRYLQSLGLEEKKVQGILSFVSNGDAAPEMVLGSHFPSKEQIESLHRGEAPFTLPEQFLYRLTQINYPGIDQVSLYKEMYHRHFRAPCPKKFSDQIQEQLALAPVAEVPRIFEDRLMIRFRGFFDRYMREHDVIQLK